MENLTYRKALASIKAFTASERSFWIVFCFFFFSLVIWICLDRTVPVYDSAFHLTTSYWMKDILFEPIGLREKLFKVLTLTSWYPPFFNWVHCLFLLSPIPTTIADNLPRVAFFAVGTFSLYKLGCQLVNDIPTSTIAVAVFCLFPVGFGLAHSRGLLDMPLAAMCFLALWLIARWHQAPSLFNALTAGAAIGLACLTKQMGVVYLTPPICLVLLPRLLAADFGKIGQFGCGLSLAAIPYLIWLLPNLLGICHQLFETDQLLASQGSGLSLWLQNVRFYLVDLAPKCLSIPLTVLFVLSLFNVSAQRKLWLAASLLVGFFILCFLRWDTHTFRYAYPILGYAALSIAALVIRVWQTGSLLLRLVEIGTAIYLFSVYFILNFTPYPFPRFPEADRLGLPFICSGCIWPATYPACPFPSQPKAYDWVIEQIQSHDLGRPSRVEVGSETEECDCNSLVYLGSQKGVRLSVTSIFEWESAGSLRCAWNGSKLNPDWYLTMRNQREPNHLLRFVTEADASNYKRINEQIPKSPKFSKFGEFPLPSGAYLVLYRNLYPIKDPVEAR